MSRDAGSIPAASTKSHLRCSRKWLFSLDLRGQLAEGHPVLLGVKLTMPACTAVFQRHNELRRPCCCRGQGHQRPEQWPDRCF